MSCFVAGGRATLRRMATLAQKIAVERYVRALLEDHGLAQPDRIEYGYTCVRLIWMEEKVCMVVDIDEPPEAVDAPGLGSSEAAGG